MSRVLAIDPEELWFLQCRRFAKLQMSSLWDGRNMPRIPANFEFACAVGLNLSEGRHDCSKVPVLSIAPVLVAPMEFNGYNGTGHGQPKRMSVTGFEPYWVFGGKIVHDDVFVGEGNRPGKFAEALTVFAMNPSLGSVQAHDREWGQDRSQVFQEHAYAMMRCGNSELGRGHHVLVVPESMGEGCGARLKIL